MSLMEFREANRVKWVGTRPGHDGEQVLFDGSAINSTSILYTVPAGKKLYLHSFNGFMGSNAPAGYSYLAIFDSTPGVFKYLYKQPNLISNVVSFNTNLFYPIEIDNGYSIRLYSSSVNVYAFATIVGWVE